MPDGNNNGDGGDGGGVETGIVGVDPGAGQTVTIGEEEFEEETTFDEPRQDFSDDDDDGGDGDGGGGGQQQEQEPVTETARSVTIPQEEGPAGRTDKQTREVAGVEGEVTQEAATELQDAPTGAVQRLNRQTGGQTEPVTRQQARQAERGEPIQEVQETRAAQPVEGVPESQLPGEPGQELTQRQQEIREQAARIQRFQDTGPGEQGQITPAERSVIGRGITDIERAEAQQQQEQLQQTREQILQAPEGTTFSIGQASVTRAEALRRLEEGEEELEQFLQETEEQPRAEEAEQAAGERIEVQQLGNVDLATRFAGEIVETGGGAAETLGGRGQVFTPAGFAAEVSEEAVTDRFLPEAGQEPVSPEETAGRQRFEETLPELTEAQRRTTGFEEDTRVLAQGIEEGSEATLQLTGAPQPAAAFAGEVTRPATEFLGEATAEEIPEKATETATVSAVFAQEVEEPVQTGRDLATGGVEFGQRAVEEPVEFGVGETVPDIGLDLALGGGAVIAAPQVRAGATRVTRLTEPQVQERRVEAEFAADDPKTADVPRQQEVVETVGEADEVVRIASPVAERAPEALTERQVRRTASEATGEEAPAGLVKEQEIVEERVRRPGRSRVGGLGGGPQVQDRPAPEPATEPQEQLPPQPEQQIEPGIEPLFEPVPEIQSTDIQDTGVEPETQVEAEQIVVQQPEQVPVQELVQEPLQQQEVQPEQVQQVQVEEQLRPQPLIQPQPQPQALVTAFAGPERDTDADDEFGDVFTAPEQELERQPTLAAEVLDITAEDVDEDATFTGLGLRPVQETQEDTDLQDRLGI